MDWVVCCLDPLFLGLFPPLSSHFSCSCGIRKEQESGSYRKMRNSKEKSGCQLLAPEIRIPDGNWINTSEPLSEKLKKLVWCLKNMKFRALTVSWHELWMVLAACEVGMHSQQVLALHYNSCHTGDVVQKSSNLYEPSELMQCCLSKLNQNELDIEQFCHSGR